MSYLAKLVRSSKSTPLRNQVAKYKAGTKPFEEVIKFL